MRNAKDFISRVVKKMGYTPDQFTVVEGNVYSELFDDIENALDEGMVFLDGSCVVDSEPYKIALEYNYSPASTIITCDVDNGITIIVPLRDDSDEEKEGINVQPLGVINTFLNQLIKIAHQEEVNEFVEETETVESEEISLKDYYRLNLPDNKIGRKSDETLIRELKEAGFEV